MVLFSLVRVGDEVQQVDRPAEKIKIVRVEDLVPLKGIVSVPEDDGAPDHRREGAFLPPGAFK